MVGPRKTAAPPTVAARPIDATVATTARQTHARATTPGLRSARYIDPRKVAVLDTSTAIGAMAKPSSRSESSTKNATTKTSTPGLAEQTHPKPTPPLQDIVRAAGEDKRA